MSQANPLPPELSVQLSTLSPTQLAWLSGYAGRKAKAYPEQQPNHLPCKQPPRQPAAAY